MDTPLRVTCLASGSSGNALLVQHGERALLVDAGIAARKLMPVLAERGIKTGSLDAILVTHEHGDHIAGVSTVSKRLRAPVVANRATLAATEARFPLEEFREHRTGATADYGEFQVTSLPVSHDAADPVGYAISVDGFVISVFTDLGQLDTAEAFDAMVHSDLVVLEANHDLEMLTNGRYPAHLKARISSQRGHLSNTQTADIITEVLSSRAQTFWLAHLSKNNNSALRARKSITSHLGRNSLQATILVARRDEPSLVWEPSELNIQMSLFGARRREP